MSVAIKWNSDLGCWYIVRSERLPGWLIRVTMTDLDELSLKAEAIMSEIVEILSK